MSLARARQAGAVPNWIRANRPFAVAFVLMAATAVGIRSVGWVEKLPVPWPPLTQVDGGFRLTSLPDRFGPYVKLTRDKDSVVVSRTPQNQPEGERVFTPQELEELSIETYTNKQRYDSRASNWYVSRIYRDTRKPVNDLSGYWRLELFYYTGMRDKVPHVPERCLSVGGATVLSTDTLQVEVPSAPAPWDKPIRFAATRFEIADADGVASRSGVEYYLFSLNGQPQSDWKWVRLSMSNPWVSYCYFAKMQFAPLFVKDPEQADQEGAEFMRQFLPYVLQNLPSAGVVENLEKQAKTKSK